MTRSAVSLLKTQAWKGVRAHSACGCPSMAWPLVAGGIRVIDNLHAVKEGGRVLCVTEDPRAAGAALRLLSGDAASGRRGGR